MNKTEIHIKVTPTDKGDVVESTVVGNYGDLLEIIMASINTVPVMGELIAEASYIHQSIKNQKES